MATVLTVAEFRGYHGLAFADVNIYPDAMIQAELDDAQLEITETTYRGYFKRAAYYLTAHYLFLKGERNRLMMLAPAGGPAAEPQGMMSNSSAGDISSQFDFPEYGRADEKFLASTLYGQEYLRFKHKMGCGPLVANSTSGSIPTVIVSPLFHEGTW